MVGSRILKCRVFSQYAPSVMKREMINSEAVNIPEGNFCITAVIQCVIPENSLIDLLMIRYIRQQEQYSFIIMSSVLLSRNFIKLSLNRSELSLSVPAGLL